MRQRTYCMVMSMMISTVAFSSSLDEKMRLYPELRTALRALWGDAVESKVDVVDQTINDETSVLDVVQTNFNGVLKPTLLSSADISGGLISITSSGNYRLQEDVSASIRIQASYVDLDLDNRVVLGALFIPGDYDYISVHDGIFLPPADTAFSDVYGVWCHLDADFVTLKNLIIMCDDAALATLNGRDGMWIDGENAHLKNCFFISGSALAGSGKLGGNGIRVRLGGALHAFIDNTTIMSGNGGSNAVGNGGGGGHGIWLDAGSYAVVKNCTFLSTGNGGDSSANTGGDGGHGIFIDPNPVRALVIDCVIKNTGVGGSGTPNGSDGSGIFQNDGAVDQNYVLRCRAHNISGFNFSLENSGLEDGVQLTYPPDSTAVNAYADVYVS